MLSCILYDQLKIFQLELWVVIDLLYDFFLPPFKEAFKQSPRLLVIDCYDILQTDDQFFLQGYTFAQLNA